MDMEERVDLFTYSKELEDIMLAEYPGKIFENQHEIDETEENKMYCFYNLNRKELIDFLKEHKTKYEYEIMNSETGSIEGVNVIHAPIFMLN